MALWGWRDEAKAEEVGSLSSACLRRKPSPISHEA